MRLAILFPLIALALCMILREHLGLSYILLWPALSFLLIGIAYALGDPRFFGKRRDGSLAWWSILLLLPYLLLSWSLWHIIRLAHHLHSNEPYASQIAPSIWLSRRILKHEIPPGVDCIVDLTCEFPAAPGLPTAVQRYESLPTLDYAVPSLHQAQELLVKLQHFKGGILFHCAQGHGRSALLAAAYLVATGQATTAQQAIEVIKKSRPNIRLTRPQYTALLSLVSSLTTSSPNS